MIIELLVVYATVSIDLLRNYNVRLRACISRGRAVVDCVPSGQHLVVRNVHNTQIQRSVFYCVIALGCFN